MLLPEQTLHASFHAWCKSCFAERPCMKQLLTLKDACMLLHKCDFFFKGYQRWPQDKHKVRFAKKIMWTFIERLYASNFSIKLYSRDRQS